MKETTKYMATHVQEGGAVAETTEVVESLLYADEAAARLKVPATWLYAAAREGRFPCVRMGRHVRFRPADVDHWIATGGKGTD